MDHELIKTIARVRRAMPRNTDVMIICDALEQKLQDEAAAPERNIAGIPVSHLKPMAEPINNRSDLPRFDRTAYQREYMRQRRARKKAHDTSSG